MLRKRVEGVEECERGRVEVCEREGELEEAA